MTERKRLIKELENYEPYATYFPHLTIDGGLVLDVLRFLRGKPELKKFLVDGDGKVTPLLTQEHGHWKLVQDYDDERWQCSACGCEWYLEAGNPEENNMRYCPECGAKMDEEVNQG